MHASMVGEQLNVGAGCVTTPRTGRVDTKAGRRALTCRRCRTGLWATAALVLSVALLLPKVSVQGLPQMDVCRSGAIQKCRLIIVNELPIQILPAGLMELSEFSGTCSMECLAHVHSSCGSDPDFQEEMLKACGAYQCWQNVDKHCGVDLTPSPLNLTQSCSADCGKILTSKICTSTTEVFPEFSKYEEALGPKGKQCQMLECTDELVEASCPSFDPQSQKLYSHALCEPLCYRAMLLDPCLNSQIQVVDSFGMFLGSWVDLASADKTYGPRSPLCANVTVVNFTVAFDEYSIDDIAGDSNDLDNFLGEVESSLLGVVELLGIVSEPEVAFSNVYDNKGAVAVDVAMTFTNDDGGATILQHVLNSNPVLLFAEFGDVEVPTGSIVPSSTPGIFYGGPGPVPPAAPAEGEGGNDAAADDSNAGGTDPVVDSTDAGADGGASGGNAGTDGTNAGTDGGPSSADGNTTFGGTSSGADGTDSGASGTTSGTDGTNAGADDGSSGAISGANGGADGTTSGANADGITSGADGTTSGADGGSSGEKSGADADADGGNADATNSGADGTDAGDEGGNADGSTYGADGTNSGADGTNAGADGSNADGTTSGADGNTSGANTGADGGDITSGTNSGAEGTDASADGGTSGADETNSGADGGADGGTSGVPNSGAEGGNADGTTSGTGSDTGGNNAGAEGGTSVANGDNADGSVGGDTADGANAGAAGSTDGSTGSAGDGAVPGEGAEGDLQPLPSTDGGSLQPLPEGGENDTAVDREVTEPVVVDGSGTEITPVTGVFNLNELDGGTVSVGVSSVDSGPAPEDTNEDGLNMAAIAAGIGAGAAGLVAAAVVVLKKKKDNNQQPGGAAAAAAAAAPASAAAPPVDIEDPVGPEEPVPPTRLVADWGPDGGSVYVDQ